MNRRMKRMKKRDYQRWYRLTSMKLRYEMIGSLQAGLPLREVYKITTEAIKDWEVVYPELAYNNTGYLSLPVTKGKDTPYDA